MYSLHVIPVKTGIHLVSTAGWQATALASAPLSTSRSVVRLYFDVAQYKSPE
jgi:hypothetical protein